MNEATEPGEEFFFLFQNVIVIPKGAFNFTFEK